MMQSDHMAAEMGTLLYAPQLRGLHGQVSTTCEDTISVSILGMENFEVQAVDLKTIGSSSEGFKEVLKPGYSVCAYSDEGVVSQTLEVIDLTSALAAILGALVCSAAAYVESHRTA